MNPFIPSIDGINDFLVDGQFAACVCGKTATPGTGNSIEMRSPIDGSVIGSFAAAGPHEIEQVAAAASEAFRTFRMVPRQGAVNWSGGSESS
jgi:acyl-CoA reductase-like NAD-dependent aldehyde dehydrogenase